MAVAVGSGGMLIQGPFEVTCERVPTVIISRNGGWRYATLSKRQWLEGEGMLFPGPFEITCGQVLFFIEREQLFFIGKNGFPQAGPQEANP